MGKVTLPHPFQGWFVIHRVELATVNMCFKCEVSMLTHYEYIKGNAKFIN